MVKFCVWIVSSRVDREIAKGILVETLGWLATLMNMEAALDGKVPLMKDADIDSAERLVLDLGCYGICCRYGECCEG
jgi:hypothetical protein